jgi:hypothetical protein
MRWLFGSLLFFLVSTGLLAFLATDSQALVDRPETISPHAVAQAKRLLYLNDPRRMRPGEQRVVAVPAFLLDEGANYFASRVLGGRGALVLSDRKASLHFSVRPSAGSRSPRAWPSSWSPRQCDSSATRRNGSRRVAWCDG